MNKLIKLGKIILWKISIETSDKLMFQKRLICGSWACKAK